MSENEAESRKFAAAVFGFLNAVYEVETEIWGDPITALLIRRIAQGQLEGRPFDVSSLAATLRMPTPTVSRRVANLIEEGWVDRRRLGRSYQLLATDKVRQAAAPHLEEIRRAAQRFAAAIGEG
jgi:DNA-binding IclR family transcriptional regulator